jgi:hypothetical protein
MRGVLELVAVAYVLSATQPAPSIRIRFIPFSDAQPIFEALPTSVAEPLRKMSSEERAAAWPHWVAEHDREIRARLEEGEEDTLTNFRLFGNFVHAPAPHHPGDAGSRPSKAGGSAQSGVTAGDGCAGTGRRSAHRGDSARAWRAAAVRENRGRAKRMLAGESC